MRAVPHTDPPTSRTTSAITSVPPTRPHCCFEAIGAAHKDVADRRPALSRAHELNDQQRRRRATNNEVQIASTPRTDSRRRTGSPRTTIARTESITGRRDPGRRVNDKPSTPLHRWCRGRGYCQDTAGGGQSARSAAAATDRTEPADATLSLLPPRISALSMRQRLVTKWKSKMRSFSSKAMTNGFGPCSTRQAQATPGAPTVPLLARWHREPAR